MEGRKNRDHQHDFKDKKTTFISIETISTISLLQKETFS